MVVLTRLAEWAVDEALPLDPEVVLDPLVVERFVASLEATARSRNTYRSILRSLGPQLTRRAPWEPSSPRIGDRAVAPPYGEADLERLWQDLAAQPTESVSRCLRAVMLLGLGVGLDGRWVTRIRSEHVVGDSEGVLVHVPEPAARIVPVRRPYEADLLTLAAGQRAALLVGGEVPKNRNWLNRTLHRASFSAGTPRIRPASLRSTWLVAHLEAGVRLPELAAAAGLLTVTVLNDLLPFVSPLRADKARGELRGPSDG